jgi:hypothetical protein
VNAIQCRSERGGMHSLVVCHDDSLNRYPDPASQCRAIPTPGRRGNDRVDVAKFERGVTEAVAGGLGGVGRFDCRPRDLRLFVARPILPSVAVWANNEDGWRV